METIKDVRTRAERRRAVLDRLAAERDVWVATAGADGTPCLVPLWFRWDGEAVWFATRRTNPTGRNLEGGARARLALGDTEDVVMLDGEVTVFPAEEVPAGPADGFAARFGWDPRREAGYAYYRVVPDEVRAWRHVRELKGRQLLTPEDPAL
ncbi:pyridoxamine 5'-phosphate oxidase family protein (plasmid) [Streptomyces sp. BI20]|uniref:pyridoxamine 5'-phosphate oxidase family protein n=1 Tax=Streptomyces sp. BI20 TaxID=3403460 RepID=UPI003C75DFE7